MARFRDRLSLEDLAKDTKIYFVAGPPGCGKTTYVSREVNRAVQAGKRVLLASLTKTAAQELAGRGLPIDLRHIGTLHAHAYRALGGVTIAESKADEWNDWCEEQGHPQKWFLSVSRKADVDDPMEEGAVVVERGGKTEGDYILDRVSALRATAVDAAFWPVRDEVRMFYAAWTEWKQESDYCDFTDLIERCVDERVSPPVEFDVMFLDEAQDSSRLEMMLALQWGGLAETLVIAGDYRQNLFEWRGSEPSVFLEIDRLCHEKRVLSQSYRVPFAVHARAQEWASLLQRDIKADYFPRRADDGSYAQGSVRTGPRLTQAESIVDAVEEALEGDPAATVMLLATTGRLVDAYVGAMKDAAIPYHNPYRPKQGRWNPLAGVERGQGPAVQLAAFSRTNSDVWGSDARFWTTAEIQAWAKPLTASVFAKGGKTRLTQGGPISPTDFRDLVPDTATLGRMFSGDTNWYLQHLTPGVKKAGKFDFAERIADRRGVRTLTETPRVIVGTVHSVKGGEATTVLVAPDLSRPAYETWTDRDMRDQTVRVYYVAMTRAIENLVLLRPSSVLSVDL